MNGIIVVDKPQGWTSQDVCARLRHILNERHVGHVGTLDPMATGVLPVFCGRATRAASFCENSVKSYRAGMLTGTVTDTQDTTGRILFQSDLTVTRDDIMGIIPLFTGEMKQVPPMYSAVKVNGKRLYNLARDGKTVERSPRSITVYSLTLSGSEGREFFFDITCSKGTYVRTLINDIGEHLGCGACMSSLRRTAAGSFTLDDAVTMGEIEQSAADGTIDGLIRSVDSVFLSHPAVTVYGSDYRRCLNGTSFSCSLSDGLWRIYAPDGTFLMLGQCSGGIMKTVKNFFESVTGK